MAAVAQMKTSHLIRVHVIEARGLKGMDSTGTSDSFCIVQVGPTSRIYRATDTKFETVNAVWERVFTLENVMLTEEEFEREKIAIKVMDRNNVFSNEMIGMFEFSLENVHRQKGHEYFRKWVPLTLPDDPREENGYLLLSVYVLKESDPTPNHLEAADEATDTLDDPSVKVIGARKPYMLNVLIYKASHLLPTYSFRGALNPFVSVRFNSNTQQTKKMSNLSAPIWNRKLTFPFFMPLNSDSIEIQVWNDVTARPDVLIGSQTFSYFKLQLTTKPWGPKWINLYSANYIPPKTSQVGSWVDWLTGAADRARKTEYVGRVLCRISVMPVRRGHPHRLMQSMCNPTIEPPAAEYAVNFLLYSGSEIPVLGGRVSVELVFGGQRRFSKMVMGKNGTFTWNYRFEPIYLYCPKDLAQVHDVIINVYHESGWSSRKICYERIPVTALLPETQHFFINGEEKAHSEFATWQPKWRTLNHVYSDDTKSHVIAGFLLCSIGFGLRKHAPPKLPKLLRYSPYPHKLTIRVHQAANLPPANEMASCDPYLVLRFAGQSFQLDTKEDNTYPYWYDQVEFHSLLDSKHAPSLYLAVYHKTGLLKDDVFLGRAEVSSVDLFDPDLHGRLFRVPLYSEESHRHSMTRKELDRLEADVPYVLLSFKLQQFGGCVPGTPPQLTTSDWKDRIPGSTKYSIKVEPIGFRKLDPQPKNPVLLLEFPIYNMESDDLSDKSKPYANDFRIPIDDMERGSGGSLTWQEPVMVPKLPLPNNNLHGVPMRVRLIDRTTAGETLVGAFTAPVASFINGHVEKPPWYIFGKDDLDEDEEDKKEKEEEEEEEKEEKKAAPEVAQVQGPTLNLDPKSFNVEAQPADVLQGGGKRNMRAFQRVEDKSEDIAMELESRPEYQYEDDIYREFQLRHGDIRLYTPPGMSDRFNQSRYGSRSGLLKTFLRVVPVGRESKLQNDDLLEPLRDMYAEGYIVRIYVYKGVNITPKHKLLQFRQTANPYLVVSDGQDDSHKYTDRINLHKDEVNPMFYRVVELPADLPANNELEVAVWDAHEVTESYDSLIGSTTIDLEWRKLHKLDRGEAEYRMLKKPGSEISYGKLLMRVDILTEEEARRQKADDLRPPQPGAYELRMVMWTTRGVRFGEEKDKNLDVNQKLKVSSNFTGTYGQEVMKTTDVAWYSAGGADWNYRMKWRVELPAKVPRLKIALWDHSELSSGTSIGELVYNLKPFFDKALQARKPMIHQDPRWVSFRHPNFPGVGLGDLNLELWLLSAVEADQNPVGEAQDEPNVDPFLPKPSRNPPPWAVGTRGLDWLARRRRIAICICISVMVLPIIIPFLLTQLGGGFI